MSLYSQFSAPGAALFLTLVTGFILSRQAKPYSELLFNIHKLMAIAVILLVIIQGINGFHYSGSNLALTALAAGGGLCVVALLTTGGFMRAVEGKYDLWHFIHVAASVTLVALAAFFFFK
jgi:hypothetical protein